MKISLEKNLNQCGATQLFILPTFNEKTDFLKDTHINNINEELSGYLIKNATQEGFNGKDGQHFAIASLDKSKHEAFCLVGLGEKDKQTTDTYRRLGGNIYKIAHQKRSPHVGVLLPAKSTVPLLDMIQVITEGIKLASYNFDRHKSKDKKENHLEQISFVLTENDSPETKIFVERGEAIAKAVCLARDLVNEGPAKLNPENFAQIAKDTAKETSLDVEIMDEKDLKKENFGLLLAVASGAEKAAPPRVIRLHYKPKGTANKKIALVGKGVTFDSGGLDLKPSAAMLDMKVDMSGAATVLGVMYAISQLAPPVEVIGYMACVENGVGPSSYHPGDILHSRKGLSVEVANTDAEGRLVLADTINYSCEKDKPDTIIDIATLTGACMVALGASTAGLFTNNDNLAHSITTCGEDVGESFWRMPLNQQLKEVISSPIADIKNCGDRYGGAITAALFLEDFVDQGIDWAHLDIAGPATNNKNHPYTSKGGTGFAVRTLVKYLQSLV